MFERTVDCDTSLLAFEPVLRVTPHGSPDGHHSQSRLLSIARYPPNISPPRLDEILFAHAAILPVMPVRTGALGTLVGDRGIVFPLIPAFATDDGLIGP